MGGSSTSQSAVLRDGVATGTPAFDLHSWQGLTGLLKMGKESLSDPQAYAEFRNLVLQYAQQGGDAELRKQIDAIAATFGTKAAPAPERIEKKAEAASVKTDAPMPKTLAAQTKETKKTDIRMRRLPPQFSKTVKEVVAAKPPAEPEPVIMEEEKQVPTPPPPPPPPEPAPSAPESSPQPAPEPAAVSAPPPAARMFRHFF